MSVVYQSPHSNYTEPAGIARALLGSWLVAGLVAAVVLGGWIFYVAESGGITFLQTLPSWAQVAIASVAFVPFVILATGPTWERWSILAPLVFGLGFSAVAALVGHLAWLQAGEGWPWALIALSASGAVLWLWTLQSAWQERALRERSFSSWSRQHADLDAVSRPAPPAVIETPAPPPVQLLARPQSAETAAVKPPAPAASSASAPPTADANSPAPAPQAAEVFRCERAYPRSGLDALAGMAELKAEIRSAIQGFRSYASAGAVTDRNGILLSGPPGNGKTAMATAIAGELGLPLIKLGVQDLTSKWLNDSPGIIRDVFSEAGRAPTVLFLDEFDAVGTRRDRDNSPNEDRKVVNALLAEIDKARDKPIVLIAATNFPDDLDAALIRDGRFDFRIEIPYPDCEARLAVLTGLMRKFGLKAAPSTLQQVARLWERRSISFIEATVKRLRDEGRGAVLPATAADFKRAARAASRRAGAIPAEGERLSELALAAGVRAKASSLLARLRHWEDVAAQGGEPPTGLLLSGPPGTGKTSFVRALARELGDWHVFEVSAAEVLAQPRKFREVVELAATHRPAFVFLDEADELLRDRRRSYNVTITNEILKAMDGLMGKVPEVVFVAATNNIEAMDPAALRGGRFGERIDMPRLRGADLVAFLDKLLAQRSQVRRARDVTAATLAREFDEIAPADALAVFSQAVNRTYTEQGTRPITLHDIRRARQDRAISQAGGTC